MSTSQALQSVTRIAAEILDIDKITGTLEVGKMADVIIVQDDPLKDITVLQEKPHLVIKKGKIIAN
ncbi:MAG: amidohydrolase family protein [Halanaerobiales bacterium]|nr:amidohydrolase family protein [Halanaerobiales bacterium]